MSYALDGPGELVDVRFAYGVVDEQGKFVYSATPKISKGETGRPEKSVQGQCTVICTDVTLTIH